MGDELTALWQTKVPKRMMVASCLWTIRNRPELATQTKHITTPAGWCAYRLTGTWNLGIGEASGMFPVDANTGHYNATFQQQFNDLVNDPNICPIQQLLPHIKRAGEDAGCLTAAGATLLGLDPEQVVGIPVAPAEGDQIAALAGSLIAKVGTISCCFGTSVCANVVGDRPFQGVSPAVDQFCAADGAPVNMVWLRNGTTFLNTIVESFGSVLSNDKDPLNNNDVDNNDEQRRKAAFAAVMPQLIAAPADCGGLLALPFMNDEPGLQVPAGGCVAVMVGWNADNATAGHVAKAALLSTMFNLKLGCHVLDQQGYPRTQIVLTGSLSKTPACGQILADVFDTPVTLLASAEEGCSWGAAVMAKYRRVVLQKSDDGDQKCPDWCTFLESIQSSSDEDVVRFTPNPEQVKIYEQVFTRYQKCIALQSQIAAAIQ